MFLVRCIPFDLMLNSSYPSISYWQILVNLRIGLEVYLSPAIDDLHACGNLCLKTPAFSLRFVCGVFFMAPN